ALVSRVASEDTFLRLEKWLQIAPFDVRAHEIMLDALAKAGRLRDAEDHLAQTIRAFETEGIDWVPLRDAWAKLRGPRIEATPRPPPERKPRRRASVAVMPFAGSAGDGVAEDIIMQLARMRVLFVIGRGSVFALAERGVGAQEAARLLDVDYLVTG